MRALRAFVVAVVALLATLPGCAWLVSTAFDADASLDFNAGRAAPAAPSEAPLFLQRPIFAAIDGKAGSHAPTLVALDSGELLAAWYSYGGPHELDGAEIFTARLTPGAENWSDPWRVVRAPPDVGNPVLAVVDGRLALFHAVVPGGWSAARVAQRESTDGGRTWSAPRDIALEPGSNVRSPPVPVQGGWVLPAYDDLFLRSMFLFSKDGRTWQPRSAIALASPHEAIQPSLAPLSDGRLLAVMRNVGGGFLWAAASNDDGRTWTRPIDAGFPNPASPAALLRLASGRLALVFNDSDSERRPLSIALSPDDGLTWTHPVALIDGDGSYAYPSLIQTSDGLLHVAYSHDRAFIGHITLNEAWVAAASLRP